METGAGEGSWPVGRGWRWSFSAVLVGKPQVCASCLSIGIAKHQPPSFYRRGGGRESGQTTHLIHTGMS